MPLPKRKEIIETLHVDVDDGFDYSIPTVREVREQYVVDGQFVAFCNALERSIKAYGLKASDFHWKHTGDKDNGYDYQYESIGWMLPRINPDFKRLGET